MTTNLPLPSPSADPLREARAVWISRFDWGSPPMPRARLEALIQHAADAGFNIVLLQVRAIGDAYYRSGLEPWAYRLTSASSTTLGVDPGWDPLAVAIETAHSRGLQLHAYLNVYPVWECNRGAPPHTNPEHPFWSLSALQPDGSRDTTSWRACTATAGRSTPMGDTPTAAVPCQEYIWGSPGIVRLHEHTLAVVRDLAERYDVDGVHFDRVRYGSRAFSPDPETLARLKAQPRAVSLSDWQRATVTLWVKQAAAAVRAVRPGATVSAAVWFTYKKTAAMHFPTSQGFHDYYQDSHRWLREGAVDALAPMIYGPTFNDDLTKWQTLAADHMRAQGDRQVWLGIGAACRSFDQIAARIDYARQLGARGVALWSAGAVETNQYWDDFKAGPFREPAQA